MQKITSHCNVFRDGPSGMLQERPRYAKRPSMVTPIAPTAEDIRALADAGQVIALRVVPGAKVERAAIENGTLKLWTRTAPEDGKATKAVLVQLAGLLGVAARDLELVSGATSREKRVRIGGGSD